MTILKVEEISLALNNQLLLKDFSVVIKPGESWAVLGLNAVGKTMLLQALAGLFKLNNGMIYLNNQPLHYFSLQERAKKIGLLWQQDEITFPIKVIDAVMMGRHPHLPKWSLTNHTNFEIARQALDCMDLLNKQNHKINTLSGGERRRAALATLLTQAPDIYLLDEPLNQLDPQHQCLVMNHLQDLYRKEQKSMVVVLHDINFAYRYCTHAILLLGQGRHCVGPIKELFANDALLTQLYQQKIQRIENENHCFWFYS